MALEHAHGDELLYSRVDARPADVQLIGQTVFGIDLLPGLPDPGQDVGLQMFDDLVDDVDPVDAHAFAYTKKICWTTIMHKFSHQNIEMSMKNAIFRGK